MIKRILVPTDFSECSYNAIRYAALLAMKLDIQEMVILHAYAAPLSYADLNISYDLTYTATAIEEEIDTDFKKLTVRVPELAKVNYKTVRKDAYLDEAVFSVCLSKQIDLVIMGTKGASGIDEVVLGTNTHRIIKEQICPVLVIPEDAEFSPVKNIALSSDYKGIMSELLYPLKALRNAFGSDLHIIHISDKEILEKEKLEEAKSMELHLKDLPHQYHFLVNDNLETALEQFAMTHDIGLLVVYPRKRGFFESIFGKSESKSIIFHTKIPLLALSPYKKAKH